MEKPSSESLYGRLKNRKRNEIVGISSRETDHQRYHQQSEENCFLNLYVSLYSKLPIS